MEHPRNTGPAASGLVRTYAWMMLLATALALAAAAWATHSSRTYEASAEFVVHPSVSKSGAFLEPSMPTEQRVVTSGMVVGPVAQDLSSSRTQVLDAVKVSVPVDTDVIALAYRAPTPGQARDGAAAFTREYLAYRNPAGVKPAVDLVTPATLPRSPVSASVALVYGVAVLGGLMVGFVAAFLWDRLRGRLRTLEDVRAHTDGMPVVVSVPRLAQPAADESSFTARSPVTFDQLVTKVPGLLEHRQDFVLLVTGATPRSGTSTVARQTALALARLGRRVVLVEHDRSGVGASLPRTRRRDDVLSRAMTGYTLRETGVTGLRVAVGGANGSRGPGDLGLDALDVMLRTLTADAVVVVDGPAAESAGAWCHVAHRVLLTVELGGLRSAARAAAEALEHCRDKVVGTVTTVPKPLPPLGAEPGRSSEPVVGTVAGNGTIQAAGNGTGTAAGAGKTAGTGNGTGQTAGTGNGTGQAAGTGNGTGKQRDRGPALPAASRTRTPTSPRVMP